MLNVILKLQENKKLLAAIDVAIKAAEKTSGKEKVFRATLLEISNLKKDKNIYPPRGITIIDPGDKLIIFVPVKSIKKVQEMLSVRLDYY